MEESDPITVQAYARVGSTLNGRWHLDRLVGLGGMAAVYAATHRNGKRVAVKILHLEISLDDNARQRFLREGYAANQVGHRGAVAADDDGTAEDGTTFLVMELLEGETIEQRAVRNGGTLPASELLALMDQALATLAAAHQRGIVHRDLKPENLFLTREGVLKVLDFGIARVHDRFGTSPSQTQGVMGTPAFMAPEQARGRWDDVDARTDLWAIGATIFSALSGRVVHRAETPNETLVLAVTERAPALASVARNVHPVVAALVDKALSYERELRFQSASEFRCALRAAYNVISEQESLPPMSAPELVLPLLVQAAATKLPTESGVAASVRGAERTRLASSRRASKIKRLLLALAGVAALALLGAHSWFGAHGKPTPVALEALALAASPVLPVTADSAQHHAVYAVSSAAPAANATPQVLLPPVAAHTSVLHRAVARSAASATPALPSLHVVKASVDLFAKRH